MIEIEEKTSIYGEFSAVNWINIPMWGTKVLRRIPAQRNKVVNDGLNWMVTRFISDTTGGLAPISGMAVGTGGSVAPVASDHQLNTETFRVQTTNGTSSVGGYSSVISGLFPAVDLNGTSEVALLTNYTSGGVMICRGVYSPSISGLPLGSYLTFTYTLGVVGD